MEYLRQSVRAPEISKTSGTMVCAAEHILAVCVRDVVKFFTSSTLSLTVGHIWHSDVRDDFQLPVSISPSSPLEAAANTIGQSMTLSARVK